MSDEELKRTTDSPEPTPELPDGAADVEPQDQPLAHHEPVEAHTADDVDEHGVDEYGHEEARLGPIDWPAWSYAAVGLVVALAVVVAFWVAAY